MTASLLLATGCRRDFRPELAVYLTGTVTTADGVPAPKTNLVLTRDASLLELFNFGVRDEDHRFFGGVGAPCTYEEPCSILDSHRSGSGGEVKMQTPEGAGSGLFRRAVELHLIGYEGERYQNRGAISFRRFIPNRNQMRRDLVVWDPSLDYDGSVATWTAAPPQVLEEGNAEHSLWFGSRRPGSPDGSLVWPVRVETP